ncbi:MAG: MFS transporter [Tepidisphaerales bacterium]
MTTTPIDGGARPAGLWVMVPLSAMMFLQYAVWGVWLPYLANYLGAPVDGGGLGFSQGQLGWILGLAGSIGALTAPLIAGQVADRYFNAERALAVLLLLGGVVIFLNASSREYGLFLTLAVLYSVLYMPTLSLTNSIAFSNLPDAEKWFPPVRLWGTIGWIVASNAFTLLWLNTGDPVRDTARIADALRVSGVLSVVYAVFSLLVLPKTPPKPEGNPLAFLEALGLLRKFGFLLVTLVALPIAAIHQAYFFRVGPFYESGVGVELRYLGPVLSLGQVSEIVFLLILGLLIKSLGYRGVLLLGVSAYVLRFAIFATAGLGTPAAVIIAANALHGLCYGCFFATAFLFVERSAPAHIRHSAQTVFGMVILGLGPILAGFYNQNVDRFAVWLGIPADLGGGFTGFWAVQAGIAFVCLVVLYALFPKRGPDTASPPHP